LQPANIVLLGENLRIDRYQELKERIVQQVIKPSQRAIRQYCQCNQEVATRYQQALEQEGIIERMANGRYQLIANKGKLRVVQ